MSAVKFAFMLCVGGAMWVILSEMYSRSLPRQIGIIVAVTNTIITGVDDRPERERERERRRRKGKERRKETVWVSFLSYMQHAMTLVTGATVC